MFTNSTLRHMIKDRGNILAFLNKNGVVMSVSFENFALKSNFPYRDRVNFPNLDKTN